MTWISILEEKKIEKQKIYKKKALTLIPLFAIINVKELKKSVVTV